MEAATVQANGRRVLAPVQVRYAHALAAYQAKEKLYKEQVRDLGFGGVDLEVADSLRVELGLAELEAALVEAEETLIDWLFARRTKGAAPADRHKLATLRLTIERSPRTRMKVVALSLQQ